MGIVTLVIRLLGCFLLLAGPAYLGIVLGANHFDAPGDLWVREFVYAMLVGLLLWVASLIDAKRKKSSAPTDHSGHPAAADRTRAGSAVGPEPVARTQPEQPIRQKPGHQQTLEPPSYYRFCANCGRPRTSSEKFCHGCGLLGYAISLLALGMGFLWIYFDGRGQGWHDKLAGTFVVRKEFVK